jgi:hypothetical protein
MVEKKCVASGPVVVGRWASSNGFGSASQSFKSIVAKFRLEVLTYPNNPVHVFRCFFFRNEQSKSRRLSVALANGSYALVNMTAAQANTDVGAMKP